MNVQEDPIVQDFLKEIREVTGKSIQDHRSHLHHLCLLAGAMAAFSMPVYASSLLSELSHGFIAIAISSLLLCILVAMWRQGSTLEHEWRNLRDMRLAIEEQDEKRTKEYQARRDAYNNRQKHPDILGPMIRILFSIGILFLIITMIIEAQ